jgi:hypothetical protein
MVIMSLLVTWLNFHGILMITVYAYYLDFKNIILAGFDPRASIIGAPTFPMWGYGWLLILTESKIVLIAVQFSLAILSIWYGIKILVRNNIFTNSELIIFKALLIFSIPWYAFQSIRWPYSISGSLITISLFTLGETFFYTKKGGLNVYFKIVISALLFGLALNFRSDYYLLPVVIFIAIVFFKKFRILYVIPATVWLITIYLALIPWGLYSKKVSGHFLFTSTNSGHVFYVGLGNLPDNKWGITQFDNDPKMAQLITDHYGAPKTTLVFTTDSLLKKEFFRLISNNPKEYLRKCFYSFCKMSVSGVYSGEFWLKEKANVQPLAPWIQPGDTWVSRNGDYELQRRISLKKELLNNPIRLFSFQNVLDTSRILIDKLSSIEGKLIVFLSFLLIPFSLFFGFKRKNWFNILFLIIILYQIAINVFAYNWSLYTTNVFLYLIMNLVFAFSILRGFFIEKGTRITTLTSV